MRPLGLSATRRRRLGFGVVPVVTITLMSVVPQVVAQANPAGPHDPIGAIGSVTAVTGGVRFVGWAADPDALTTNDTVGVLMDGRTWVLSAPTSVPRPRVASRNGTGPTPGFDLTVSLDANPHVACVVARNIASGLDTVLTCVATPLGTTLSGTQLAARNPQGRIEQVSATSSTLTLQGWATDPDYVARRATVVLYVDGASAATVITHLYPTPRPSGASARSAFVFTVPVTTGAHIGCIWVVNVGLGNNAFLGCRARDTRGVAGTGTVSVPSLNTKVVTEAKSHIGDAYVWGATGPHQFDCSGLVMYSYGKFGFTTPRVSQAQSLAARLIPASRAVPGDLVFTHDNEGNVFHVGIFVKPGQAVAAIDTQEGVNYQNIWDPGATTYGSFTHT